MEGDYVCLPRVTAKTAHYGHLGLVAEDRLSDNSPLTGGSACLIPSHPVFPRGATAALERLSGLVQLLT